MDQIKPNVVEKVKKQALPISFFHILHGEYKQKEMMAQILVWKFKANIARNASFEDRLGPDFCLIWVKNGKN